MRALGMLLKARPVVLLSASILAERLHNCRFQGIARAGLVDDSVSATTAPIAARFDVAASADFTRESSG